jgi:TolA-binding protein
MMGLLKGLFRRGIPVVLIACLCAGTLSGEVDTAALTAEGMVQQGSARYHTGDYEGAERLLSAFVSSYAESPEATGALAHVLPLLVLSSVRLDKFSEAAAHIERWERTVSNPLPLVTEEMRFWKGVCQLQMGEALPAVESLQKFARDFPRSNKREEACLLAAATLAAQERHPDVETYLAGLETSFTPAGRSRAAVLRLYALIQSGKRDDALALVMRTFPQSETMLQIISFHTLSLELGSAFLDEGEYQKAIACLQRVWHAERLRRHQEARLRTLEAQIAAARERGTELHRHIALSQMAAKVRRELDSFRKIKDFDAALRLRVASAFREMGRFREAALVMEEMLRSLPPGELVEQASISLIQCWIQEERWPEAVRCADLFAQKFPESKQTPLVLFLRGYALQNDMRYAESIVDFAAVAEKFPKEKIAEQALFLKGFGELLLEEYPEALRTFKETGKRYPKSDAAESACYWIGETEALAKHYENARRALAHYLKQYREGRFTGEAAFRRAYCAYALKDFDVSIKELRAFLRSHDKHAKADEAKLLLGEALMAVGQIDKGIAALKQVGIEDRRLFEEAWFKIGKALRAQEKLKELRKHMEHFRIRHAGSPRVVEAVYWIGWTLEQEDRHGEATEMYWKTIETLGNAAEQRAVEDLFVALIKRHQTESERTELRQRLARMRESALAKKKEVLALRAAWAAAKLEPVPEERARLLAQEGDRALNNVENLNPLLLADLGDAAREAGQGEIARKVYRELVRWNPRAPQKDRALAGLGFLSEETAPKEALAHFARFKVETLGSPLTGKVLLAEARILLRLGKRKDARDSLEALLEKQEVSKADKADALVQLGELHLKDGKPDLAVPYFQRVYVMYGRWPNLVARAYLKSGEAFELMEDEESARRTYEELLSREELNVFAEYKEARERLEKWKGDS